MNEQRRVEFYQEHLNRVSRSFAFCIERLVAPHRAHIGLAYLVCRILDSVEDAEWADKERQLRQFREFDHLLTQSFSDSMIQDWLANFPPGLPEGECLLLRDAAIVLRDVHALPPGVRDAIVEPVLSMSRGMAYFTERRVSGQLRLHSLTEMNQYCFFVAGVVGEILTRLISLYPEPSEIDKEMLVNSFHFGLFLQKVNLLKDQMTDEPAGRFLVPSRLETLFSMREHARRAISYIVAVPERLLSYRLFCSWSLFLGLASLPFIEKSWNEQKVLKIPRLATQRLLAEIETVVGDNERLLQMFEMFFSASGIAEAPWSDGQVIAPSAGVEFPALYRGRLAPDQLSEFGLS